MHQREGIAFLWNCVTGVNGGIRDAYNDSRGNEEEGGGDRKASGTSSSGGDVVPRGAVLADEMGLGKVRFRFLRQWKHCLMYFRIRPRFCAPSHRDDNLARFIILVIIIIIAHARTALILSYELFRNSDSGERTE